MTDHPNPRPALLSTNRRFGRYEPFRRFDHLASHASVATDVIGKMTVDCQFLFEKSQWGVLGDSRFPAGIMYMDLNFGPPRGCKVKSATVTITLDEYHESLGMYYIKPRQGYHKSGCPVQMTDCYGPRQLVGEAKCTEFKQTMSLAPEIHAFGGGAGGIGVNSEKAFKSSSRWAFNGQLLPGKGTWTYKTLKWNLTDNELKQQTFQKSCVHTAFTFQHAGQPFTMKVDIEGRLEKWNDRIKSKLKFGSARSEKEGRVTTLVDFQQPEAFKKRLDELARSLPRAMELANYQDIPVEIPDIASVSFQSASTESESLAACEMESTRGGIPKQECLDSAAEAPSLEAPRVLQALKLQEIQAKQDSVEPTVENITRVLRALTRPDEQEIIGKPLESSFPSTSNTVVAPEDEREQMTIPKCEKQPEPTVTSMNADQEAVLRIIQIPGLLAFLQLIATLVGMLGGSRKAKAVTS
ncbi:hypothetical protein LCI18_006886 [Fusarium solani-melongenae]|uniref:Uncharacterized protein n=1 Tax=Fusarium solani subsp. cucurbitae TaxID=2747967 RepID=A0ACD3Z421_FUSSC|nr:hypothetical protein LCI18_006886 [Fusarium solani-melongenae]